jgi:hypothetical protein
MRFTACCCSYAVVVGGRSRPPRGSAAAWRLATDDHFDWTRFVFRIRQHRNGRTILPSLPQYVRQSALSTLEASHTIASLFQGEPVEVAKVIVDQASNFAHKSCQVGAADWFGLTASRQRSDSRWKDGSRIAAESLHPSCHLLQIPLEDWVPATGGRNRFGDELENGVVLLLRLEEFGLRVHGDAQLEDTDSVAPSVLWRWGHNHCMRFIFSLLNLHDGARIVVARDLTHYNLIAVALLDTGRQLN